MDLRTGQWCQRDARRPGGPRLSRAGLAAVAAHHRSLRAGRPAVRVAGARSGHGDPRSGRSSSRPPTISRPASSAAARSTPDRWRSSWATRPSSTPRRASCPRPTTSTPMRLNWGPYLWMRCYNNGAQFLDQVVGAQAGLADARSRRPATSRRGCERDRGAAVRLPGAVARRDPEALRLAAAACPRTRASSSGPPWRRWRT